MRRISPHNSAQSQLNLRPHNSPFNWTKLTSVAAYFWEMEMRHYNTWLFSEVATRCLHQFTNNKAIIDRKRGKFLQIFQFPFDITLHHFDSIMSDSTDSELEIVDPSPVWAHTNSSVAQKSKEKKARSFVFNRRRNTCQATPKCGILRRKRQIILQIVFYSNGSFFPAICFECSLHRWHPQITKGASSPNGSNSGFIIYYVTGPNWSSPRRFSAPILRWLGFWNHKHYERNLYNWRKSNSRNV